MQLPESASGQSPMQWVKPARPVWAWVYWDDGSVERIATVAHGWNNRVVDITVPGGYATVWRSAVTHRQPPPETDLGAAPAARETSDGLREPSTFVHSRDEREARGRRPAGANQLSSQLTREETP